MEFAQKITRGGQVFTNLHHQTLWLCSIGSTKCFCKCTQHHLGWAAFMKRTNIKQAMNQTNNPRFAHCLWFHHCWVGELWTFQSLQEVHSPPPERRPCETGGWNGWTITFPWVYGSWMANPWGFSRPQSAHQLCSRMAPCLAQPLWFAKFQWSMGIWTILLNMLSQCLMLSTTLVPSISHRGWHAMPIGSHTQWLQSWRNEAPNLRLSSFPSLGAKMSRIDGSIRYMMQLQQWYLAISARDKVLSTQANQICQLESNNQLRPPECQSCHPISWFLNRLYPDISTICITSTSDPSNLQCELLQYSNPAVHTVDGWEIHPINNGI